MFQQHVCAYRVYIFSTESRSFGHKSEHKIIGPALEDHIIKRGRERRTSQVMRDGIRKQSCMGASSPPSSCRAPSVIPSDFHDEAEKQYWVMNHSEKIRKPLQVV